MYSQSLPSQNSHHMTLSPEHQAADDAFCCGASLNPADFASRIRCFGLDLLQIDQGKFRAKGSQARIGKVLLGCVEFERATVQTWTSPARSLTIAAKTTDATVRWRGLELQSSDVLIIGPGSEVELVSMAGAGIAAVTFLDVTAQDAANLHGLHASGNKAVLVRPRRPPAVNDLLMVIITLLSCASIHPWVAGEAEWAGLGRNDLLNLAVSAISGAVGIDWRHNGIRRPRALELAVSAMRSATSEDHLNVPALCRMVGVSERTLHTAFVERYTVSPARFMKAYRLNRLRQDLAQVASQRLSITEIANNLGFHHLGQLARDYRTWFGELPSATYHQSIGQTDTDAPHTMAF